MLRVSRASGIGLIILLVAIALSACGSNEPEKTQQTASTTISRQPDGSKTETSSQDDNTNADPSAGDAGQHHESSSTNDAASDPTANSSAGKDTATSSNDSQQHVAGAPASGTNSGSGSKAEDKTGSKAEPKSGRQSEDKPKPDDDGHMQGHEHADSANDDGPKDDGPKDDGHKNGSSKDDGAAAPPASSSSKPGTGTQKPADSKQDSAKGAANNHIVEIVEFAFSPAVLEVQKGDTVTFINRDAIKHSATADDESFDTKPLGKDEQMTVTFDEEGDFSYYCLPHPAMTGTIAVKSG